MLDRLGPLRDETLRSPQEKMPQREACLAGGYIATRLADGKSVRFKKMKWGQRCPSCVVPALRQNIENNPMHSRRGR